MPWVKLDDQYADHPKIRRVGAIGLALQTAAICYCGRFLTDGFLSFSVADALIGSVLAPITQEDGSIWTLALTSGMGGEDATMLDWKTLMVSAGLWEKRDGGFTIHDYLDYNPSKKAYRQILKSKRIAGQAGGQASAQARAQAEVKQDLKQNSTPFPFPSLSPKSTKKQKQVGTPHGVLSTADFLDSLRANPVYRGLDIDRELAKMDAWLLTPRGRGKKKTRGRIVAWLNRALEDVPLRPEVPDGFQGFHDER